ncbi:MAG: hypothetical protein L0Z62_37985 [Gemmataceae bacterium]|nr:hypothetical protein [Gemmataceae bacterium]
MDADSYILERQLLWARRRGTALEGSQGERGFPAYTPSLEDNLFEPLTPEARREYEEGDGRELRRNIRAVHSSSALACNVFAYWKRLGEFSVSARACSLPAVGVTSLRFEAKLPVAAAVDRGRFPRDPNLDVLFAYDPRSPVRAAALECKFGEAYSDRGHAGLRPAYLEEASLWAGLPHCRALAEQISPDDGRFRHLHAAQLLKHVLALRHAFGPAGFRLVYLWYDVPCPEGAAHRDEISRFGEVLRADGVDFQCLTYQEVILRLARDQRAGHPAYVDYLAERYL